MQNGVIKYVDFWTNPGEVVVFADMPITHQSHYNQKRGGMNG
jgi:hypothetical protein